jgi:hypothetical protein
VPTSAINTYVEVGLEPVGGDGEVIAVRLAASTVFGAGGKPCCIAETAAGSGIWEPSDTPSAILKYPGATDALGNFFPGDTATPPTQAAYESGIFAPPAYIRGTFYTLPIAQSGIGAISSAVITALGGQVVQGDTTNMGTGATQANGCLFKF